MLRLSSFLALATCRNPPPLLLVKEYALTNLPLPYLSVFQIFSFRQLTWHSRDTPSQYATYVHRIYVAVRVEEANLLYWFFPKSAAVLSRPK
eukprot:IDg19799t1